MAATVQDVRNVDLAESLRNVDDARITCVLNEQVPCYINESAWGSCAGLAQSLVAAHLITIALRGSTSAAGPVVSESAGGLSRSYAAPASTTGSGGFWASTTFGQRYQQLASTRMTTPIALTANIAVTNVVA